jgi:hypothetical protein
MAFRSEPDGKEFHPSAVHPVVLEKWKRSRVLGAEPFSACSYRVKDKGPGRRRVRRSDLREFALACIRNLYRTVAGTNSLNSLSNEDCILPDVEKDESIRTTSSFPHPGAEYWMSHNPAVPAPVCDSGGGGRGHRAHRPGGVNPEHQTRAGEQYRAYGRLRGDTHLGAHPRERGLRVPHRTKHGCNSSSASSIMTRRGGLHEG